MKQEHDSIPFHLVNGAKSRKELSREYGMSESTFYRLMKKHKLQLSSGLLLPKDYLVVYETLGLPTAPPPHSGKDNDSRQGNGTKNW
jgi:hypothetical protein